MIKVPKIGSMMLATKAMSDQGVAPLMLLWKSFPILLWLVPKIGFYWVIIMESSIAQMMGESDRAPPYRPHYLKSISLKKGQLLVQYCCTWLIGVWILFKKFLDIACSLPVFDVLYIKFNEQKIFKIYFIKKNVSLHFPKWYKNHYYDPLKEWKYFDHM